MDGYQSRMAKAGRMNAMKNSPSYNEVPNAGGKIKKAELYPAQGGMGMGGGSKGKKVIDGSGCYYSNASSTRQEKSEPMMSASSSGYKAPKEKNFNYYSEKNQGVS